MIVGYGCTFLLISVATPQLNLLGNWLLLPEALSHADILSSLTSCFLDFSHLLFESSIKLRCQLHIADQTAGAAVSLARLFLAWWLS